jgi:hypothetical protein
MKKLIFIFCVLVLIAAILIPSLARGASISAATTGSEAQVSVSAVIDFPMSITFDISASGSRQIYDIRLHYTVNRMKLAEVISEEIVSFTPSKNVSAQYVMDMRQTGGFPPGASLNYWLTVVDSAGTVTETLPRKLTVNDERYQWQSLQEGKITLYWYDRDNAYGRDLMDTAQEALVRVGKNSGAALVVPVSLYIYASNSDLLGALVFAQDWTGGIAFTEYNIIAIGIGPAASDVTWGKDTIFHELAHLAVNQVTYNAYSGLPPWLSEGLAMNSETELDAQFSWSLEIAVSSGTLITIQSLCSPFSAYADKAVQAYAESYEIVRYLIDNYGQPKMLELLTVFENGSSNNAALQAVYGFDMAGLDKLWQAAYESTLVAP